MRKKVSILLGFSVLLLAACNAGDEKIPEMANDFCNCFKDMEQTMSTDTKDIMKKAAESADPETTMKNELEKLEDEKKMAVAKEMMSMGEMQNKESKIGRCMADVEKKYGGVKTFNQKKSQEKLVKELETKRGCDFTAALMKIGLKSKKMD